jgi:NADH:ubiquinone oxidoreductase subunit 5 (subunit L)/multisubunit Na+/H+ antiporter MnhA subunit
MTFAPFIPLLPLAAFLILGLFGRSLQGRSHRITIPAFSLSFVCSVLTFFEVLRNETIRLDLYTFLQSGSLVVEVGLYLDSLTAVILLLVTGVSTLVHLFSSRYMQGDPREPRFFAVLSLFAFVMIMLIMSTNLLMLYLFWELVGLCSYLLISHQAERPAAGHAATRVFLTNAVADVGLGLAVLLSFATFDTLDIQRLLAAAPATVGQSVNLLGWLGLEWRADVVTMIALLFFFGAMGKSAQFPLHVWLPFAMEAPTPVSALIHAATLVKAGVYLVVRMSPLFVLSPAAMIVVMVIGGVTALLAAAIALTQSDIKRILAYSTMSQLGLMMMTCGAGAFVIAVYHLLAHGIVKAFLFLSSGGALRQGSHHHPPEYRPLRPAVPLLAAALMGMLGLVGLLALVWGPFYHFLLPAVAQGPLMHAFFRGSQPFALLVIGLGIATVGWALASWLPLRPAAPTHLSDFSRACYLLIWNKLYLDEVYDRFVIRPILGLSRWLWRVVDVGLIERTIVGCGTRTTTLARWVWLSIDLRLLGGVVQGVGPLTLRMAHWLWRSVDIRALGCAVEGPARITLRVAHWLLGSVDIRLLGWAVDGSARITLRMASWLWRSVDIRGLEWLVARVGRQNEAAGEALREIEPSLLQHQLLVMIFTLVAMMTLFLIFLA